jgi:hypothetical protein
MRPLIAMAGFVLLVGLTPVVAQHGGGHVSAGGHGGFAGHGGFSGHSNAPAGGHGFGGMHSGSGFAGHSSTPASGTRPLARPFSHAPHSSSPLSSSRNFNHFHGRHEHRHGFRSNCYGYGCGWGYGYPYAYPYLGGGIDPYWWWDSGSSNDNYPEQQGQMESADDTSAGNYEAQPGDQDAYARSSPAPRQEERTETAPATVLVFRDQHRQEVQNYAIVGQTLWSFAPQHTQKIPLADLDVPATTKANDERGVDFHVPGTGQGQ